MARVDEIEVGPLLRAWREHQGWTVEELARHAGIKPPTLYHYETGRRPVTVERLELLISMMGIGRAQFFASTPK